MAIPIFITCSITHSWRHKITSVALASFIFTIFSPFSTNSHNTQTPHNVISDFLLGECGFSQSELATAMRRYAPLSKTRSSHIAREVVQLLRDYGFTQNQVKKTIVRNPSILIHKQLKPKIEIIKTVGFTDQDLANLMSSRPRVLRSSLERILVPNIHYFESLFGSKPNICKTLKRAPDLLEIKVEKQLKPKLDLLKQCGVQGELLSLLLSVSPFMFNRCSVESLQLKIKYVKDMGIWEGSKIFVYALGAVCSNNPLTLGNKLKHLTSFGLLEEELHQLLKNAPSVLRLSTNKMQQNMDFLMHTARLPPNVVVKYPRLLHYSLEKRLKPRFVVFRVLTPRQHSKPLPALAKMFGVGEQTFVEKFIKCSPQPETLNEIYKGKPVDSKIP